MNELRIYLNGVIMAKRMYDYAKLKEDHPELLAAYKRIYDDAVINYLTIRTKH